MKKYVTIVLVGASVEGEMYADDATKLLDDWKGLYKQTATNTYSLRELTMMKDRGDSVCRVTVDLYTIQAIITGEAQ